MKTPIVKKPVLTEKNHPYIFQPSKKVLVEDSKTGKTTYVVEGIFGKIGEKNENRRYYPFEEFERNLKEDSDFSRRIGSRSVLGELEHPDSGNTHLARVSHLITKVWMEQIEDSRIRELGYDPNIVKPGHYVLGRFEVLETPNGNILKTLFESNIDVGVSSRGRGDTVDENGVDKVVDYELDTFDCVYLPSVIEARPKHVTEADEDLGDPGAVQGGDVETAAAPEAAPLPATNTNWQSEAEETVRALQSVAGQADPDPKEMVELVSRGMKIVDILSTLQDATAIQLKSQINTLTQVLNDRVMSSLVGKDSTGASVKKETKDVREELEASDLAKTAAEKRKQTGERKPVFRGEIEATLKKSGHEDSDTNVQALAGELRSQGLDVRDDVYESSEKIDPNYIQDGEIIMIDPKTLIEFEDLKPELKQWFENQEGEIKARVCSKGVKGFVLRFFDSPVSDYNMFYPFEKVKRAESKEIDNMKFLEVLKELIGQNKSLRDDREKLVASKEIIEALVGRSNDADIKVIVAEKKAEMAAGLVEKLTKEKTLKKPKIERKVVEDKKKFRGLKNSRRLTEESKARKLRFRKTAEKIEEEKHSSFSSSPNLMSETSKRFSVR